MHIRPFEASLGAILALAGCGTGASGEHADDGGGPPPADAAASENAYGGRVVLEHADEGMDVFFAAANFSPSAGRVLLEGCSDAPLASGSCCFLPGVTKGVVGGGHASVSAGSIAITSDGAPLGQLSFGPDGYDPLRDPPAPNLAWRGGDTLQVTATGDVVGPFSGTVVAPHMPEILSLPEPHGSVLSMSIADGSSKPTYYTWVPAGPPGAKVLLVLVDQQTGSLKCLADDAAGVISIPPQFVGPNFHAHDSGYLYIGRLSAEQAPQNADVEIASFGVVVWGFLFTE